MTGNNLDSLLNDINPLNLNENFDDNVVLYKLILNLCNDRDIKLFGTELLDSLLLYNFLINNRYVGKFTKNYSDLCKKLSLTINKYSKFDKLLRNCSLTVPIAIDDVNDKNIIIASDKRTFINAIFNKYNLIKNIICLKNDKLKKQFDSSILNIKLQIDENKYCDFTKKIAEKKNVLLSETIISDNMVSDGQAELFDKINEEYKQLLYLEYQIQFFELFIDKLLTSVYYLEDDVETIFSKFKEECEKILFTSIKERFNICEKLNIDLETYSNISNFYYIYNEKKNKNSSDDFCKERLKYYKEYLNSSLGGDSVSPLYFFNYLKKKKPNDYELLENEKSIQSKCLDMYSSYLIYKAGLSKSDSVISFEEFISINYDEKDIDAIYKNIN